MRAHQIDSASRHAPARGIRDLAEADAVLAGAGAAQRQRRGRSGDRAIELSARSSSSGSSGSSRKIRWKLPSPTWPTIGARRSWPHILPGRRDAFGEPRDRHADVGGPGRARRGAAPARPNRRRDGPSTGGCGPRARSPSGSRRRRSFGGDRLDEPRPAPPPPAGCRGIRRTASALRAVARASSSVDGVASARRRAARSAPPGCPTGWWR